MYFKILAVRGIGFGNNGNPSSDEEPTDTQTIVGTIEFDKRKYNFISGRIHFSSVEQFIQFLKDTYPDNLSCLEINHL